MISLLRLLGYRFAHSAMLKCPLEPPNSTVGAVHVAEQRTNALWTATKYELSFQHGNLIVWCWFSAGCAGGDRFCRRSLNHAVGRTAQARDRRLCDWLHLRDGRSQL